MIQDDTNFSHLVGEPTFEGLARYIQQKDLKRILVMAGAGISVAAGIPDFRSPNTGVYANVAKYNLDSPADAFSLSVLKERPDVFYSIVREMDLWPGHFRPTTVHHFIKLLSDEGRLLMCCTQNIDGLERVAGVPQSLLVEAHGSFTTASCIECCSPYDVELAGCEAREGKVPHCGKCGGVVKPDVVFFGENLPDAFFNALQDVGKADLLLIMGTSLQVSPFAELAVWVRPDIPRVLFNLERVGGRMFSFPTDEGTLKSRNQGNRNNNNNNNNNNNCSSSSSSSSDGWGMYDNHAADPEGVCRDIFFPGDCQLSVRRLAEAMGLGERLASAVREGKKKREGHVGQQK